MSGWLRERRALAALLLAALVVRIPTLGSQSFWRDEAVTVKLLHKSFGGMLGALPDSESTPPLYYAVAWVWARIFGFGEAELRSLSVVFGVLLVAVVYRAAEQAFSRRAGVIAALLASVNPFLVWYSQEARAYALFFLLGAWSFLWFLRAVDEPSRRNLLTWSVISALALTAHYFACFLIAAEAAWLLFTAPRRREVAVACVPWVVVGLALLPLAHAQGGKTSWIPESGSLPVRTKESVKNFLVGLNPPGQPWTLLVAGLLFLAALWLFARHRARAPRPARAAAVVAVAALVATVVVDAGGLKYVNGRNVGVDFIPVVVLMAAGLAAAAARLGAVLTAALAAISLAIVVNVYLDPAYQKENWRLAFRMVGPTSEARGIVGQRGLTRELVQLYGKHVDELPAGGAEVRQIAAVDATHRVAAAPRVPGFRLVSERTSKAISVFLYESQAPRHLTPAELQAARPEPGVARAFAALQLPSGGP